MMSTPQQLDPLDNPQMRQVIEQLSQNTETDGA